MAKSHNIVRKFYKNINVSDKNLQASVKRS